ncbi:pneumococcal serine-rich repeat protein-like [Anthonomus grandis grandis]|uniref:pneumococcal serine-rich repeat protein-like n=1 Tax=Anthonomus grandis grandis TaxID=2921223 RepID=UPI002166AEA6|nr:pneumococcal serine-rich repeat protein-like [Anthonomus grandis grandis]
MRRTLIILVSVAVNLCLNTVTNAHVIAKAGAAAGSYAQSGSNAGSYSGATAHAEAHASAVAGSALNSGAYYGEQHGGTSAQSISKTGALTQYGSTSNSAALSGCLACRQQQFPGPNGSIHDYKLASAVAAPPHGTVSAAQASATATSNYQHPTPPVSNLPGAPGAIYSSNPTVTATQSASSQSSGSNTAYVQTVVGQLSPGLVASFPGPSGSIHDSKPATAIAGASASSGSNVHVAQPHPQPAVAVPVAPALVPNPQLSQIIPVLPGQPGSIYNSKPVAGGSQHVKEIASESSSEYHGQSGSALPNPQLPQLIPVLPGQPGSIYNSKPVAAGSQHIKEIASGSASEYHDQSGSITNIPDHVKSDTSCQYVPGAVAGKCGTNDQIHVDHSGSSYQLAQPHAQATPVLVPVQPNPQLSQIFPIHSNKPSVLVGSQSVNAAAASQATSSGYHDESGSITNIPAHIKAGSSSCRYVPGLAGNSCGSSGQLNIDNGINSDVGSSGAANKGVSAPSVHPETPLSGTYYINKPSTDLEAPIKSSFSGQIPCAGGSSCIQTNQGLNTHDAAHLSGGIVFQNEDGSYHGNNKAGYKNSENGHYAVSTKSEDNKGVLIGPGTGHLPIENSKPFGTQGAFGGSAAFSKSNAAAASNNHQTTSENLNNEHKPFGTQGAFGGSTAYSKSDASANGQQSSVGHQQPLGNQGAYLGDKSGSYSGHGTFGVSKAGSASGSGAALAVAKAGSAVSNEVHSPTAGQLIDVRDNGVYGLSGSFLKSSSSSQSYSSASASSSAVSYSGTF